MRFSWGGSRRPYRREPPCKRAAGEPVARVADVLRSELLLRLGFRHGFNLRSGGASTAEPYASFNLGRAVGDDPAQVAENHRRFASAVGYADGALFEVSQVHGPAVVAIDRGAQPLELRRHEADGLVALAGQTPIGVRVADCAPLLLADVASGAVAALHAGWRGTVAGVVEAGVAALLRASAGQPDALRVAVFPHIRACCFEVGDDVADTLRMASPSPCVMKKSGHRPHVDLFTILAAKLAALGIAREHVEDVAGCTRCESDRFFSFRRDGKHSGRHLAAIVSR